MPYVVSDPPYHANGSATTVAATVTLDAHSKLVKQVFIQNTGNDDLLVSFDGGTTYYTIPSQGGIELESNITSFKAKAGASSTTYAVLYTVADYVSG